MSAIDGESPVILRAPHGAGYRIGPCRNIVKPGGSPRATAIADASFALRLVEGMPLDAEGGVEAGTVVLPGADGGHLDDDIRLEVLAQPVDEVLVDCRRCRRRALGVFDRVPFSVAEPWAVTP